MLRGGQSLVESGHIVQSRSVHSILITPVQVVASLGVSNALTTVLLEPVASFGGEFVLL